MLQRPRRNRKSEAIRNMIAETQTLKSDLISHFLTLMEIKLNHPLSMLTALDGLLICCYTN